MIRNIVFDIGNVLTDFRWREFLQDKGFDDDITGCQSFDELPQLCKDYIARLEELCECPVKMVGVGPSRAQNLER